MVRCIAFSHSRVSGVVATVINDPITPAQDAANSRRLARANGKPATVRSRKPSGRTKRKS